MKMHFLNCPSALREMLEELSNHFGFSLRENGIPVRLEPVPNGLSILKGNGEVTLGYSSRTALCRSIYLLMTVMEKDSADIQQACAFQELGILLDVSRNSVLTVETVMDLLRHLACMGYNTVQLYTEDTLEVKDEPYFGYMRGRLTVSEIQAMDAYASLFGIELVPCIQTLAHMNQITRYERYDKITDTDDILFAGEERTYTLLENIFKTLSEAYSSRKVNIGMDEAHMLGLGKYLDKHGYRPRFEIMVEHLEKVRALCRKYGFEPQMWSDMFFRLVFAGEYYVENTEISPELAAKIPQDIRLVYWDYYSPDTSRYDRMLQNHKKISPNIGFAGGAWKWTGFAPDNAYSIKTCGAALEACRKNRIESFLLTCWGDNGAEASIYSVLPAMYFCAQRAYDGDSSFDKSGFKTLTGMEWDNFTALDLPNRVTGAENERNNASKFLLYNDVLMGTFDSLVYEGMNALYLRHAQRLGEIRATAGRYAYLFDTMEKLCRVLSVKAELGCRMKKAYVQKDRASLREIALWDFPKLSEALHAFYQAFMTQWHKENKSFGFEVQCIRLGGLMARSDYAAQRLLRYTEGMLSCIDELEQPRLPFAYFDELGLERMIYNLWNVTISPSVV